MPKKANPVNKRGDRNYKCDRYAECLTYAARQDWRYMSCEACPYFKKGQKQKPRKSQMENKRICEKCGEKPTIQPKSPYCSGCLHDMKRAKEKGAKALKKKNEGGYSKPKPEKAAKTAETAVTIEFGKYVSVIKEVEELADREMRPLGMQVAYMLRKYIETNGGC